MMDTDEQSVSTLPHITAWQAETLRLTVFHSPDVHVAEPTWWAELRGEPPEIKLSRPKVGAQREEGPFEEGKLVLAVQMGRIDWLFTIAIDKEPNAEGILTIGNFPESLGKFLELMQRWFELGSCPSAQRLAFGAVLLQPVESLQKGYRRILEYLPYVESGPEGSSDFLYQINRPRDSHSEIPGLRINRLSKWSVAGLTRMQSKLSVSPPSVMYFQGQEHFACRLGLDINTAVDLKEELTREQLPVIFRELVDLGKQIAQEGDIP